MVYKPSSEEIEKWERGIKEVMKEMETQWEEFKSFEKACESLNGEVDAEDGETICRLKEPSKELYAIIKVWRDAEDVVHTNLIGLFEDKYKAEAVERVVRTFSDKWHKGEIISDIELVKIKTNIVYKDLKLGSMSCPEEAIEESGREY